MYLIYRKFVARHIAEARRKSCYIDIFKVLLEHKIEYTRNDNSICPTRWRGN